MKKTKIIIKNKAILQNTENFINETQELINKYLNEGYEIKSSNFEVNGNYAYIYVLMQKEVA